MQPKSCIEEEARWFGDSATMDLRPGGRGTIGWSEFDAVAECIVEVVDRPKRFSFRWDAIEDTPVETASTLVEFTLEADGHRTHVTLVESGFTDLPEAVYEKVYTDNSSGWDAELRELADYVAVGA